MIRLAFSLLGALSLITGPMVGPVDEEKDRTVMPKGKLVVFSLRDQSSHQSSYLVKSGKTLLLKERSRAPVFSPNGRLISAAGANEIYLFDDNGRLKKTIPTENGPRYLEWAPDSTKLLYSIEPKDGRRVVLEYDFSEKSNKVFLDIKEDMKIMTFTYSPDGKQILFDTVSEDDNPKEGLYLCDADGRGIRLLKSHALSIRWFPDGRYVAYYTDRDEEGRPMIGRFGGIYKMNVETGESSKLQDLLTAPPDALRMSRDGQYFYMAKSCASGGQNIVAWPIGDPNVEIPLTECVDTAEGGASIDQYADWYQSETLDGTADLSLTEWIG